MKVELHGSSIVREEIEKGKEAIRVHNRKSDELRKYIGFREIQESQKKLH